MGNQLNEALKALGSLVFKTKPSVMSPQHKGKSSNPLTPQVASNIPLEKNYPNTRSMERSSSHVKMQNQSFQKIVERNSTASDVILSARSGDRLNAQHEAKSISLPALSSIDFELNKTGDFHPHAFFTNPKIEQKKENVNILFGVNRQLSKFPQNETDLIIGLDFGTSSTKMVIRDVFANIVFPVKVNLDASGLDQFLKPSYVYLSEGVYALSGKGERLDDLKLSLLSSKALFPVTEFNHCCAYLALMIRSARAWFLTEQEAIYRNHQLNWFINVGLAARSYEDDARVQLFRRLAWAAANLASDSRFLQITQDAVDQYRALSRGALSDVAPVETTTLEFSSTHIGVIPEVAAQIQGFMTSARWDWKSRPIMMLVDVGAGTVDTALFHVNPLNKKLTFYSTRVESNGAMNLHRERVSWLRKGVSDSAEFSVVHEYLNFIEKPTGRIQPIPSAVADYLPGYRLLKIQKNVDELFRLYKYRTQVAGSINDAKVKKGIGAKGSQQLIDVPLLLCGGGARLPIYSTISAEINQTTGWGSVSVEQTSMPVPVELRDTGWHSEDFDRISVAYGLSLEQGLEKIVRSIDVPDIAPYVESATSDRFVSKDQC